MKRSHENEKAKEAIDRYFADDAGEDETAGSTASFSGNKNDEGVFARCDAVMALIPKVAESADLAWAFDEARQLARSDPRSRAPQKPLGWYSNPAIGWCVAGVLTIALVIAVAPTTRKESPPLVAERAATEAVVTNVTFAPIVISTELAQTLAEVAPVVMLANGAPVDSRSLAVLPFAQNATAASSRDTSAAAASIYDQVIRELNAYPGLLLIDAATAAVYADSELTPEEIAVQLGVRGVVEGRIDSFNGDIRFELRFTDAAAQGLSMNAAIERPSTELAMLQSDITSSVLGALASAPSISETVNIL